ncbi:DUF3800 domain-containing protein [uncultured Microbacterium sp.]|uniref:DUF3800 domain-containing protein n=1 Tax=uncultured Microbacterium sp. TaxID=191216 RepID=UPI002638BE5D|nr:DUF3800 domain-containing protein [uncultured Microbacterium sp.]
MMPTTQEARYSDYVVYVDESRDHSLTSIDPEFPMFALSFCVFEKVAYFNEVVPAIESLKFDVWGHDSVILHENDIRKSRGPFSFLLGSEPIRSAFFDRLNATVVDAPFTVIASVINKQRHCRRYSQPISSYEIALLFCMERLRSMMIERGQRGRTAHVIFESRGGNEDRDLEREFHRICANEVRWGWRSDDFSAIDFRPVFTKKAANSSGLQLADLTARPIALHALRPEQNNRAYELIRPKIQAYKVFP